MHLFLEAIVCMYGHDLTYAIHRTSEPLMPPHSRVLELS